MHFWKKYQRKITVFGIGFILLIALGGGVTHLKSAKKSGTQWEHAEKKKISHLDSTPKEKESVSKKVMMVEIKGAVVHPDVYTMQPDERVTHLIAKAGGLSENADAQSVNRALVLEDQMVIYIPVQGEVPFDIQKQTEQQGSTPKMGIEVEQHSESEQGAKINLNTATEQELTTLNGIGPKKAQQIISHREEKGAFKQIEDLKKVSGFGEKTFENLKDFITV